MKRLIIKIYKYLLILLIFKYYPIIDSFILWLYIGLLVFHNNFIFRYIIANNFFYWHDMPFFFDNLFLFI